MDTQSPLQQFREKVSHKFLKRSDAAMDLIDALTVAGHVESPVALSEEAPFRRKFSMVYDVLENGDIDAAELGKVWYEAQPAACETLAGYEVYAVDTTPNQRPDAETLPERELLKKDRDTPAVPGWKFSWLVRLVQRGTSWVAPQDVQQVAAESTESQTGAEQVKALGQRDQHPKVVTADSRYFNHFFLALFVTLKHLIALVRMRNNSTLYEAPPPKPPKSKGAPRKHGDKFKLANPTREPDRTDTFVLGALTVVLTAWHSLHLRKLPTLVGMALRVEFRKADGTPRYKRPMWLFWTGPLTVSLREVCLMYLWRFAIEHAFRFLKQHFGLNANQSTNPDSIHLWMRLCALAYWQLVLMRDEVEDLRPPWHSRPRPENPHPLTPGQAQRGALRFLTRLGTPASSPRPAGKGCGRASGYHPQPRKRHPVLIKSQKQATCAP